MQIESLYHSPHTKWAYSYDSSTFHLRVRTKKNDVNEVTAITGDKYDWDNYHNDYPMLKIATDRYFDYWETELSPAQKRFSYAFRLQSQEETIWMTESGIYEEQPHPPAGYYEMPYMHEIDGFKAPEWAKSAIFYQIMPDRFANGDTSNDPEGVLEWGGQPTINSHFGGDLQGIIDHLDYLTELGVTAIYLTPIFEAPSNHKYDTVDYRKIDPHFGDTALLKELVAACHAQEIKVVLDAVFNHSSVDFPPFRDVLTNGKQSKYVDWFHIRDFPVEVKEEGPLNYETFGFFASMPKLNTTNPEVKQYLLDVAEHWLKEVKIDGWRLDVANEIDHSFWRDFRKVVKHANPEAYIIGEAWSDSLRWLLGDQFDSVMNYPFSDRVLPFFQAEQPNGLSFAENMNHILMRYPTPTNEVLFNLLGSHDTPRVLTMFKENKNRLKLAVTFLLTYLGTPCIFYGDEIGLKGEQDPDCRKCMEWDESRQDKDLFNFYKRLIALRKEHEVLRFGRFTFLRADAEDGRIIYERSNEKEVFTIWMNHAEETSILAQPADLETEDWQDAFSGEPVKPIDGFISMELEPFGFRILRRSLPN
ncbi:neopullulanase [Paenibacillus marchantiophytorum]|uniref:Neopullulanase n=1 Tax=Paenibacillus marchantiophytorum TaxID=1619310 RepID=A0ABQ1EKY3_9BACL|nr:alpha-glycosidase [Paenibacillus marchantiophytorum]GFZ76404.1 neopullulanase [Paenibacillus marchantiophytorum]